MTVPQAVVLERNKLVRRRIARVLGCARASSASRSRSRRRSTQRARRRRSWCWPTRSTPTWSMKWLRDAARRCKAVLYTGEPLDRLLRQGARGAAAGRRSSGRPSFEVPPREDDLLHVARRARRHRDARRSRRTSPGAQPASPTRSPTPTGATRRSHETIAFAGKLGAPKRVGEMLGELAHELLMNALYDAPVDDARASRAYAHDRKAEIALAAERRGRSCAAPPTACASPSRCSDRFGRLERKHVFGGLVRGAQERPDGHRRRRRRARHDGRVPLDDRAVLRRRAAARAPRSPACSISTSTCASSARLPKTIHFPEGPMTMQPDRPTAPIPATKPKLRDRQVRRRRHHLPQARRHHRRAVRGQEDRRAASRAARWSSTSAEIERICSFGIREWVDFITAVERQGARRCGSSSARPRSSTSSTWSPTSAAPATWSASTRRIAATTATTIAAAWCRWRRTGRAQDRQAARARLRVVRQRRSTSTRIRSPSSRSCRPTRRCELAAPTWPAFLASQAQLRGRRRRAQAQDRQDRSTAAPPTCKLSGDLDGSFPRDKLAEGARGRRDLRPRRHRQDRSRRRRRVAPADGADRGARRAHPPRRLPGGVRRAADQDRGPRRRRASSSPSRCPTRARPAARPSAREIDVAQHYDVLKFATPPELKCPDCSGPTTCAASEALLAHLPSLPRAGRARRAARSSSSTSRKSRSRRRWPPRRRRRRRCRAARACRRAPTARARRLHWTTALVAVGIVIVRRRRGSSSPRASRRASRGGRPRCGEKLEASQPTRPTWVDQTFFREADRLLFVGHSTLVADKADGFAEAESGALEEVANQIGLSIRDPQWIDHVRAQYEAFRTKAIGDLEKATVSRRRRRARARAPRRARGAQAGGRVAAQDRRAAWRRPSATISTGRSCRRATASSTRCRSATPSPRRTSRSWSSPTPTPETAMGAKAVCYFPQLGWRFDVTEGAVVTHVANDSTPALRRHPGGRPRSWPAWTAWCTTRARGSACSTRSRRRCTREGGTLVLKVKRGDAPAIDTRLRIARGGQASADSVEQAAPDARAPQRARRPSTQEQEPDGQHLGRQPRRVSGRTLPCG